MQDNSANSAAAAAKAGPARPRIVFPGGGIFFWWQVCLVADVSQCAWTRAGECAVREDSVSVLHQGLGVPASPAPDGRVRPCQSTRSERPRA